jgi:ribonuclease VapC
MFIDASVVVAILTREPDRDALLRRLETHKGPFFTSPLVRFEAVQALVRKDCPPKTKPSAELVTAASATIEKFLQGLGAEEISISPEIGVLALEACASYGKAVGHPARLNFGDCFAYACAKVLGVPLSYKGSDFARTDLA